MHSEAGFWCGSLKRLLWLCRGIYCEHPPSPLVLKWVMGGCNTLPWHCSLLGYNISPYFWRKFAFFLLHRPVSLLAIRCQQTHTPTFLPTEPCYLALLEILSVYICLCPSSPTTNQSFVMHVRWSIYSLHLHCVLGMWHWSNSSLRVLAYTVRHRPVNSSNVV